MVYTISKQRYTKKSPEFKALKMKYFWQQKASEILVSFSGLVMLWYIPLYLGMLFVNIFIKYRGLESICKFTYGLSNTFTQCVINNSVGSFGYWLNGILVLVGSIVIIIIMILITKCLLLLVKEIYGLFRRFIQWNLDKAEKRAKNELGIL